MTRAIFRLFVFLVLFLATGCMKYMTETDDINRFSKSIRIDGLNRTYLLNLPPDYHENPSEFPLVIGLHGAGGKSVQFEQDYRFTKKANDSGFIAVYPEGIQSGGVLGVRTWNAGTCCHEAAEYDIDDVGFIATLIDELISNYRINPARVYIAGMSNGGMMAYRLACEISDKIAAIAVVSGSMVVSETCSPARPVPVLHIHSQNDTKVPYMGGIGIGDYHFPPVDTALAAWVSINSCHTSELIVVDDARYKYMSWPDCSDGSAIELYLTKDGGHSWPGGQHARLRADPPSEVINATDVIWDFFQRFGKF